MGRVVAPQQRSENFRVQPLTGHLGARIADLDLRDLLRDPKGSVVKELRDEWLRWKVLFLERQSLSRDEQIAFGSLFGDVLGGHPTLPAAFPRHPEVLLIENAAESQETISFERRLHTDLTFLPEPPMASILRGVTVPHYGGDTQWVNLARAYETLSDEVRDLIDGLHAVHRNVLHPVMSEVAPGTSRRIQESFESDSLRAVHPVVRVHPETGARLLFVNPTFTDHLVEVSRQESRHILAMLFEHLSRPDLAVRYRWSEGSVAMWDNRATAHVVIDDLPVGYRRQMERITLAGDLPSGTDGEKSYVPAGIQPQ